MRELRQIDNQAPCQMIGHMSVIIRHRVFARRPRWTVTLSGIAQRSALKLRREAPSRQSHLERQSPPVQIEFLNA